MLNLKYSVCSARLMGRDGRLDCSEEVLCRLPGHAMLFHRRDSGRDLRHVAGIAVSSYPRRDTNNSDTPTMHVRTVSEKAFQRPVKINAEADPRARFFYLIHLPSYPIITAASV